ncbi:hypothetical protein C8F01DRAFT_223931 [Mycena amicta]|nr:hypothetical protein C8F01DRAFT_223931 [Mycena amicta]
MVNHSLTDSAAATATGQVATASSNRGSNALPLGLIIGASVGGMILGALAVFLYFLYRRRQVRRKLFRLSDQQLVATEQGLIEKGMLPDPFPMPIPPASTKVTDWMRRNNRSRVSVSTISSFSSPTILGSDSRTSISAYSQASVLPSGASAELLSDSNRTGGELRRPPGLDRINEHE